MGISRLLVILLLTVLGVLRLAVLLLAVGVFKILIVTSPLVNKLLLLGRVVLLVPLGLPLPQRVIHTSVVLKIPHGAA